MKLRYFFSLVFALLGIYLAYFTVNMALDNLQSTPVLVSVPEEAELCLDKTLSALCDGDFSDAEMLLYGNPSLGADRAPEDPVGVMIWNAFVESLSFELKGEFYATDDGLARDITVTSLEIGSVTEHLGDRSKALLSEWVAQAEDPSQIYDGNNEYKEELVLQALYTATEQALAEDARYQSITVTVKLVYRDGKWWVVSDDALLEAVSGGII